MNQGIRSYCKLLSQDIGNAGKGYVNVNTANANLHLVIPIYKTPGVAPIEVSLIYSHADRMLPSRFGYGCRLNYFKNFNLLSGSNEIQVTNSDGSVDSFVWTNTVGTIDVYQCHEIMCTLAVTLTEDRTVIYCLDYIDKYGNRMYFMGGNIYPTDIHLVDGTVYNFTTNSNYITQITNNSGRSVTFELDEHYFIGTITIQRNGGDVFRIEITYTNNAISSIAYIERKNNQDHLLCTNTYHLNDSNILAQDGVSTFCIQYALSGNQVTQFQSGIDAVMTGGPTETLAYHGNYSTATDYLGQVTYYYFDPDELPLYDIDYKARAVAYRYQKNASTGAIELISQTNVVNNDPDYSGPINLVTNGYFDDGTDDWTDNGYGVAGTITDTSNLFHDILGDQTLSVQSTLNRTFTVSQTISCSGLAGDDLTLYLWGRQIALGTVSSDYYASAEVTLLQGNSISGYGTIRFSKYSSTNAPWELRGVSVTPSRSYDTVVVKLTVMLNCTYTFDAVQVIRTPMGNFFQYDAQGNVTSASSQKATANTSYTNGSSVPNNLPAQSLSSSSSLSGYEYDDHGNIISANMPFSVSGKYEYDNHNNITETNITSQAAKLTAASTYDYANFPASQTNDAGFTSASEYETTFGMIQNTTDPLSTITDYDYNDFNNVGSVEVHKDAGSVSAAYTYDDHQRLDTVTTPNNDVYKFNYNSWSRILSVAVGRSQQLATNTLFTYEYQNQSDPTAVQTGNITKVTYGNSGPSYNFAYNSINQITGVSYQASGTSTPVSKFGFVYDDMGRIVTTISYFSEYAGQTDFTYNAQGQLTQKNEEGEYLIDYVYDNLEGVIQQKYDMSGTVSYASWNPQYDANGMSPEAAYPAFQASDRFKTGFMNRYVYDSQTEEYTDIRSLDLISFYGKTTGEQPDALAPSVGGDHTVQVLGMIPCVEFTILNGRLAYDVDTTPFDTSLPPNETVAFWFKPQATYEGTYLFSTRNPGNGASIGVYFTSSGKLVLTIKENDGTVHDALLTTDSIYTVGEWNFFSLTWYNHITLDPPETHRTCRYELVLNGERKIFTKTDPAYYVNNGHPARLYIGCYYNGTTEQYKMNGLVTAILMSNGIPLEDSDVDQFYLATRDYIFRNPFVGNNLGTTSAGAANVYAESPTFYASYTVIPLNVSLIGLGGKTPSRMSLRETAAIARPTSFGFNNKLRRYAYIADGAGLVYDFACQNSGFLGMRVFFAGDGSNQYIFQNVDPNGAKLGLYRHTDVDSSILHRLYVEFNGTLISTGIDLDNDVWTYLGFTWSRTIISESVPTYQYQIRLVLQNPYILTNPIVFTTAVTTSVSLGSMVTSVGRTKDTRTTSAGGTTSDPMLGQIEMLTYRNAYLSQATIQSLWASVAVVSASNQYDALGRIVYHSISKDSEASSRYQTYTYASNTLDNTKTSTRVATESFNFATSSQNMTHAYGYDGNGNVTSVTEGSATTAYEYDYRGYLTQENGPAAAFRYEYDANGNITYKKNLDGTVVKAFTYATTGPTSDRLTGVGGWQITYDAHNFGNPTRCATYNSGHLEDEILYTWEGRSLTRYRQSELSVQFLDVKYEYDASGLRIRKTVGSTEHRYVYDGSNLIYENYGSNTLRFLYDERGLLLSLLLTTTSGTSRYDYVRDIMLNIIGLTDEAGNLVVRYTYDAWGNILSTTGSLASTVGAVNPFRYKGYYYDSETEMYYCMSRYYVPQWCRWLSADSAKYLDFDSPTGINLYVYCGNNPVMNVDPSGKFAFTVFLICLIVGAILGGVTRGANAYNDGARGWELISQVAIGVGAGALIGGAVGIVAGLGGVFLTGGMYSVFGKATTDLFAYTMYGTPIGTWEDYAVVFVFGGLTRGYFGPGPSWGGFLFDVLATPLFYQIAKIGTGRVDGMNWSKYGYDVTTRAMTYLIKSPWRSFFRGVTRGHWGSYGWEFPNERETLLCYA